MYTIWLVVFHEHKLAVVVKVAMDHAITMHETYARQPLKYQHFSSEYKARAE